VLVKLGDSVTTDHISPAGAIGRDSEAGRYLAGPGVPPGQLNTFASRRGNHEVMVRGASTAPTSSAWASCPSSSSPGSRPGRWA
jgi:aconitate hydratase